MELSALQGNLLFSNLTEEEAARILALATPCEFAANEYVFQQGDEAKSLYVVEHGLVAMILQLPPNRNLTIATEGTGGAFGWAAMIPPHKHSASAKCFESTTLLAIDGATLRDLCFEEPDLGVRLMAGLASFIASRLGDTTMVALDVYDQ
jgi:CRP-like cAMP-binding protein